MENAKRMAMKMDFEHLKNIIYELNEDELFYRRYYYAKQQKYSLDKFLFTLDMDDVRKRHLLIPELPETIPVKFLDSYFFNMEDNTSIVVQRHNRYSPAIIHSHSFFELVYIYDGKCTNNISGRDISMRSGDICIIPPDIEHSISVFDESIVINIMLRKDTLHTMFYNFLNTPNILSSFFLNNIYAQKANDYILFHTGTDRQIKQSFLWMLWESVNKSEFFHQLICNTLLLDFYLIIRDYGSTVQMPLFDSKIDVQRYAIIEYIQNNYQKISLHELAKKFHYTDEYASRLIKELTGLTYSCILRTVRIERAQELLLNTNMTVAAIAESIGYETPEYFIRQFKKMQNTTPSQYRKDHNPNVIRR